MKFFLGQISFFAISKMTKNQFFELGKSLKLPEIQFHEKKLIYLISRVFFLPSLEPIKMMTMFIADH